MIWLAWEPDAVPDDMVPGVESFFSGVEDKYIIHIIYIVAHFKHHTHTSDFF